MVVLATGWGMLKREDDERQEVRRIVAPQEVMRKGFYPLTLPLTVGPGCISVAITLGANAPAPGGGRIALALVAVILGSLILALTVFLSYAFADRAANWLGPSALNVIVRLSSLLLTCVGLQLIWNGVSALLHLG
jgi:multiple antibiotic resistance protein